MTQQALSFHARVATAARPATDVGGRALLALLRPLPSVVLSYFSQETHPLNLALTRILVFAVCLYQLDWEQTLWFSKLPRELLFPPSSLASVVKYMPISPELTAVAATVFVAGCVLGLIGLFTRWASLAVLLSGLYVLLIPQIWGKVDTNNHVLWFVAILMFSPCSDALSVDAIRRVWAAPNSDVLGEQRPSMGYALPLRFIWLLLGIIYLFPGLWKFRTAGLLWATREIFNIVHQKWFELGWWTPIIRVDQWPALLVLLGIGTIAWESTFIVLVLFRRTRVVAAVAGTLFHSSTAVFMRIFLFDINIFYLCFFDLAGWLRRLGAKLYPTTMWVVYDRRCRLCRASIGTLRLLDVLGGLAFASASDSAALAAIGVECLDGSTHFHTRCQTHVRYGFSAWIAAARRLPSAWPLIPVTLVGPVVALAQHLYETKVSPLHTDFAVTEAAPAPARRSVPVSSRPVAIVGAILIIGNSFAGWHGTTSWPFTVYPTFWCCFPSTANVISLEYFGADGQALGALRVGQADPNLPVGSERLSALVARILALPATAAQQAALRALADVERQSSPGLADATQVRISRQEYDVNPDRRADPPIQQEVIMILPLSRPS